MSSDSLKADLVTNKEQEKGWFLKTLENTGNFTRYLFEVCVGLTEQKTITMVGLWKPN